VQLRNKVSQQESSQFVRFTASDDSFVRWCLQAKLNELSSSATEYMMRKRVDNLFQQSDSNNAELGMVDIVDVFVEEVRRLLKADRSSVYLVDRASSTLQSVCSKERVIVRLPIGQGIAGKCAETGEAIVIDDAYSDSRFDDKFDVENNYKTRHILCVAIKGSTGNILGVVQMINKLSKAGGGEESKQTAGFGQSDVEILRGLVAKATLAIEKAQLFHDVKAVMHANTVMNAVQMFVVLICLVLVSVRVLVLADRCTLLIHDKGTQTLWSRVASGVDEFRIPADKGIAGEVVRSSSVLNVGEVYQHPKFDPSLDQKTGYVTKSILALPILNSMHEVIAVIQMVNKLDTKGQAISFGSSDENIMKAFVNHVAVAITNSQMFAALTHTAAQVATMAKAVPDLLIMLSLDKVYQTSNLPLQQIFSDEGYQAVVHGDPVRNEQLQIDFGRLCPGMEADLEMAIAGQPVDKPDVVFTSNIFSDSCCKGYEILKLQSEGSPTCPDGQPCQWNLMHSVRSPMGLDAGSMGLLVVIKTAKTKYGNTLKQRRDTDHTISITP